MVSKRFFFIFTMKAKAPLLFLSWIGMINFAGSAESGRCFLDQCYPKSSYIEDGSQFDFIIVGAGSAGCVLASRLTENENFKVLLMDAGGDPPYESTIPGMADRMLNTEFDWQYNSVSDGYSSQSLNNGQIPIPRGKMLGGSSSINSMYFFRGSYKEYDDWCAMGNDGWCYNDVLPYFRKIENITNENGILNPSFRKYRGKNGPEKITKMYNYANVTELFKKGYKEVNIPFNSDVNGASQMGYSLADTNVYNGERQSALISYISPNIERDNLYVLKQSFVHRIIFDKNTWTAIGVEYTTSTGCIKTMYATKEVIVSAGTIGSPQLLMSSGIGPCDTLSNYNIDSIVDLPVGQNYQDHPSIPFIISAEQNMEPNMNFDENVALQQYYKNRTGLFSYPPDVTVAAFVSLSNNNYSDYEDQVFYSPVNGSVASGLFTYWNHQQSIVNQVQNFNKNKNVFVFLVILMLPNSRGQLVLNSNCISDSPTIYTGFFNDDSDLDTLTRSIMKAIAIVDTEAFQNVGAKLERIYVDACSQYEYGCYEYWRCYALNMATTAYHPVGTCRMGCDSNSVVDSKLRVKGVNNLRVIDASIMPTEPRCNINNPVLMIAEKGADMIKKCYS